MIVTAWSVLPFGTEGVPISILRELYACFNYQLPSQGDEKTLFLSLDKCTFNSENLEDVACFCNPYFDGVWKVGVLVRKFQKIIDFFNEPTIVPANFMMDYSTPKRNHVYTPLQVYYAARKVGLQFESSTTLAGIERDYRNTLTCQEDLAKVLPRLTLDMLPKGLLYQILMHTEEQEFDTYLLKNFAFYNKNKDIKFSDFYSLKKLGETEAFEKLKPKLNDYFIDEVIHPEVPEVYYDKSFLNTFGCTYQEALSESILNHFYLGHDFKNIINTETCIEMETVSELKDCLSYGVPSQTLTVFTINEVYQTIRTKRTFYTPDERKLTERSVARLIAITTEYPELNALCLEVQKERDTCGEFSDFVTQFHQLDNVEQQAEIEKTFWDLLHLGFYIRGWDGVSEYPLQRGHANDLTIYDTSKYLYLLSTSEVLNLPLLKYENEEYVHEICNDKKQTIKERINQLIHSPHEVSGCIKVASNWFVITAHKYLSAISKNPPKFMVTDVLYLSLEDTRFV